jgi:hypothetical protein
MGDAGELDLDADGGDGGAFLDEHPARRHN